MILGGMSRVVTVSRLFVPQEVVFGWDFTRLRVALNHFWRGFVNFDLWRQTIGL
jgi:hypothetical protein